jgi:hypothetical protein
MAARVRSVADRVEAPRYEELDRILDVAEPALHALAAVHGLHEARIDRWRWDQPEVVLSWLDRDRQDVAKSIRFYIDEEDDLVRCSVEVNAWRDGPDKAGRPVRKWRHEAIGAWRVRGAEEASADRGRVSETLAKAFDTVAEWDARSLTKRHYPRLA